MDLACWGERTLLGLFGSSFPVQHGRRSRTSMDYLRQWRSIHPALYCHRPPCEKRRQWRPDTVQCILSGRRMKNSYIATHLMVLFDRDGRILAGVPVHEGYAGPVPVAKEGQHVAHFDLPEADRGRLARDIDVARLC